MNFLCFYHRQYSQVYLNLISLLYLLQSSSLKTN